MGKKRSHNWKAREEKEVNLDTSEQKKIKLETKDFKQEKGYDESNELVLPSKKRTTKIVAEQPTVKKLSKKQRKLLEKVIEKREKKSKRADLFESLARVQAKPEELKLLTSTSEIHSGKITEKLKVSRTQSKDFKVNAITGGYKKQKQEEEVLEESSEDEEESDETDGTTDDSDDDEEEEENLDAGEEKEEESVATETSPQKVSVEKKDTKKPNSKPITSKPAVNIPLSRSTVIQEQRLKLPILAEEQGIMESINDNPVVILSGETGSGKTTQVPQFLYEAGYAHGGGIIGITEPRRVAAISMSKRVAEEMSLSTSVVSYQIRYEGNVTNDTRIKFMTDGVLLKEVQKDFLLNKYSVVIIDEAHERSVYTDILIGLLSRIVPLRYKKGNPLKLIIMSATLRVEDFTDNKRLFPVTPPVIKVESRQFPVTIHFNKRTPLTDFLGEAYKKVCKIHRMLPTGGILVFVTGQQEVHTLCKRLRNTFPCYVDKHNTEIKKSVETGKKGSTAALPKIDLDNYSVVPVDEEADLAGTDVDSDHNEEADDDTDDDLDDGAATKQSDSRLPLYVLPLYSLLSTDKQALVFKPPPAGCRLCVVATNVAETSLTIPNVKYVVDTGKVKTKQYDKVTGVSAFRVVWTSQASANQRAGRAGRTGPGHCYRLFSSAVYNDMFEKFSEPEILQRPVDDLILQMKDMNIEKVINFPYPTPPSEESLKAAEKLLVSLGALEWPPKTGNTKKDKLATTKITAVGKAMAYFPVAPRFGKMLALGHQHSLLPYVVAIVAGLSVQEVFSEIDRAPVTNEEKEEFKNRRAHLMQLRRTWAGTGHSLLLGDPMVLLKAVGACEYAGCSPEFCTSHGVRLKAMREIRKLRAQLTNTVNAVIPDANLTLDPKMSPPSDAQAKLLRQILLSGMADHIARRLPDPVSGTDEEKKMMKNAYQCMTLADPVYIHPSSVLYKQQPTFLLYLEIQETSKLYMKGISVIEPEWLPVFAHSQCTFSKPLDDPPPRYNPDTGRIVCHCTSTYGGVSWELPEVEMEYPEGLDRYRWFARALLEGAVFQKLASNTGLLLSPPVIMTKSWAKLQPRTDLLLKTLLSQNCDNKDALERTWTKDPKYLLKAYLAWIPESQHNQIRCSWPPI